MSKTFKYEIGQTLRRKEIHEVYGGNRTHGISISEDLTRVFLFDTLSSDSWGYKNRIDERGIFLFAGGGYGRRVSMEGRNLRLRDHAREGRDVHLFRQIFSKPHSTVEYVGPVVCIGSFKREEFDKDEKLQTAIMFELVLLVGDGLGRESVVPPRQQAKRAEWIEFVRSRSQKVRAVAIQRSGGVCERCRNPAPFFKVRKTTREEQVPYLEVHHIRRLSDGGPDSVTNVAALCPNCHREVHHGENHQQITDGLIKLRSK